MTSTADLRVLIAAAGSGSRAGLPYPKTLHPVLGRPILIRLIERLRPIDAAPTIIVSPSGRREIEAALTANGCAAELVEQSAPTGMGDAVLTFRESSAYASAAHVLLVWGDIPLLEAGTVSGLVDAHLAHGNDFTFVTRNEPEAYTIVRRDAAGAVQDVVETREAGLAPGPGERDIGLFLFRREPVFELLDRRPPGWAGARTGEHGFLYVIRHLAERGEKIEALPIATERDVISLNRLEDLDNLIA